MTDPQEIRKQQARERAAALAVKATPGQVNFLEILLNDTGYDTRLKRNVFLSQRTERNIRFLDDLTFNEAASTIEQLKRDRDEAKARRNGLLNRW